MTKPDGAKPQRIRATTGNCPTPPKQTHSWSVDSTTDGRRTAHCLKCGKAREKWPSPTPYSLTKGHRAVSRNGRDCSSCGGPVYAHPSAPTGWHHQKERATAAARFERQVVRAIGAGCDVWKGGRNASRQSRRVGYGVFRPRGARGSKPVYAHRFAWEMVHGTVPSGLFVLHHCDNPPCVKTEPDEAYPEGHLFLGTQAENVADMWAKGRNAQGRHP